jgi:hypothetical protein
MLEIRSTTQQQPNIRRTKELAGQTFNIGVPVQIDAATGAVREWDGTTTASAIAGISKSPGANLGTTGVPAVPGANLVTQQSIVNQPLARVIPVGAPLNDGRTDYATSTDSTVFYGQINPTGQTLLPTDIGTLYGMTKDPGNNQWFVDKTKTGTPGTATTGAVVKIVGFDFWDTLRGVHFVFVPAAIQMPA